MNISDFMIQENTNLVDAVEIIDKSGRGIAFICENRRLKAVISDGDVRRYLLKNGNMNGSLKDVANYNPKRHTSRNVTELKKYMLENRITAVPIVDDKEIIVGVCFQNGEMFYETNRVDAPVVVMAGGKGTRLYPYTQILPKPLIPIGNKTITEHIIDRFMRYGCSDITMIVNYKKRFIETYFAEDNEYSVKFIEEEEYLGTGGGLKLLKDIENTFFMTNCDILLEADYDEIYEHHKKNHSIITMVCAKKKIEIPYGTVEMDANGMFAGLTEKPVHSYLVNTGFYVVEPEFLSEIPENTFIHITEIIERCAQKGGNIGLYVVEEDDWMDMGQMEELDKMRKRLEKQ